MLVINKFQPVRLAIVYMSDDIWSLLEDLLICCEICWNVVCWNDLEDLQQ